METSTGNSSIDSYPHYSSELWNIIIRFYYSLLIVSFLTEVTNIFIITKYTHTLNQVVKCSLNLWMKNESIVFFHKSFISEINIVVLI